jgi:exodeoxyribonuclease V alpha subunit
VAPLVDDAQADRAVQAVLATAAPRPTPEQAAVIRAALQGRLTVVSGGPGTGKTTIVLAIVRALARLGVPPASLALAAPTGKAANRLAEALRAGLDAMGARADETDRRIAAAPPEAQTIHRLLGYSPRAGTFQHHQNNLLAEKVIIVDESSMIDLALMERLSRAVAADARLVLLGDADQLASVEAGAVFRDLGPLARRLTGSHRVDAAAEAGRRLLQLAAAVKSGALDTPIPERPTATDLTFTGAELLPPTARPDLLSRWHDHLWPPSSSPSSSSSLAHHLYRLEDGRFPPDDADRLTLLQRHVQSVRILCVTRGRPTGAVAVNEWLRRRHRGGSGAPFAPGEPVMMLRNDYDRGLFNGDQGVVIHLRDDTRTARLGAAFPTRTGWQAWPLDSFGESLELSYAMTVHKAQGSEHDRVALILPDVPIPLLTRELLYTAITRASERLILVGGEAAIRSAVERPVARASGLRGRLWV